MIEPASTANTFSSLIYGNLPLLVSEGRTLPSRAANFGRILGNSLRLDVEQKPAHPIKRTAKGIGAAAALGAEMTIGNELPVIALGVAVNSAVNELQPSGNLIIDSVVTGALVAGAVYPSSYFQQRIYGRVAQSAIADYPETLKSVASIKTIRQDDTEKITEDKEDYASDGNLAPAIGTTLALLAHKSKNPNSTPDQEDQVIKRGSKLIAGFWAATLGIAATVTTGAENIEEFPALQAISTLKSPHVFIPLAAGLYLTKQWYDLMRRKNTDLGHPQAKQDTSMDSYSPPIE